MQEGMDMLDNGEGKTGRKTHNGFGSLKI